MAYDERLIAILKKTTRTVRGELLILGKYALDSLNSLVIKSLSKLIVIGPQASTHTKFLIKKRSCTYLFCNIPNLFHLLD
jgi:hypothetical protein